MITVAAASRIIEQHCRDYGNEILEWDLCTGRTLAEPLVCDRDFPPYNRSTMDGIAISYQAYLDGKTTFNIACIIPAGSAPVEANPETECVEIMTGAPVPPMLDTVIRYEDVIISGTTATITTGNYRAGQNINKKGSDRREGDILVTTGTLIGPDTISAAATVGKTALQVKRLPKVAVITTGDELVDASETPGPYQLRRSNSYTLLSVLQQNHIAASHFHLPDNQQDIELKLEELLQTSDVLIFTGGVSMGKFDYLPAALEACGVQNHFHKIKQRPGKPFWFGGKPNGPLVFAFPGNPVSCFLCMYRYFLPWLNRCMDRPFQPMYAVLSQNITFQPDLTYFIQVKLSSAPDGRLLAEPAAGHGSGDLANLLETSAFMELPAEQTTFNKGEVYPVWPFKPIGY